MFKFFNYILFLFSSTNQHGVHSPFVFNFVTKCLYNKDNFKQKKPKAILLKCIHYFNASNAFVNEGSIKTFILGYYPKVVFNSQLIDIGFLNTPDTDLLKSLTFHNDSMVLINNIYDNKEVAQAWEAIKKLSFVIVTVDMFHCGAVFFRKEQEKEHFKIRI